MKKIFFLNNNINVQLYNDNYFFNNNNNTDGKILDVIYSEKNEILIISYDDHIEIRNINNLNDKPIHKIFVNDSFAFNMNKDILIIFNKESISFYQKINGINYYQLLSKIILPIELYNHNYKRLLKLDNKILLIATDFILYLINIKKMKIYQEFYLLDYPGIIDFIYKIKDNIYICKDNILLEFKYFQNNITLINSKKEKNTLSSLNELYNLFLEKNYPKLYNKIKINCTENKIIPKILRKTKIDILRIITDFLNYLYEPIFIEQKKIKSELPIKNKNEIINKLLNIHLYKLVSPNENELILKNKNELIIKNKKSDLRKEKIMRKKYKINKNAKKTYPHKNFKKSYR